MNNSQHDLDQIATDLVEKIDLITAALDGTTVKEFISLIAVLSVTTIREVMHENAPSTETANKLALMAIDDIIKETQRLAYKTFTKGAH